MQHIVDSGCTVLIVDGIKKAEILKQTVEGEKTNKVPSSLLQDQPNVHLFLDKEVASLLEG